MNLEQIYYASELIASVAVIATLIYVAKEVRQNTSAMRANSSQAWTELNFQLATPVALDREVAERWIEGGSDFESLDSVDQQRLVFYEWRAIEAWHHSFHLHEQGVLPEWQWQKIIWILENQIGHRQSVKASWKSFKGAYDQPFQDFMSQYIE